MDFELALHYSMVVVISILFGVTYYIYSNTMGF